jgi:hypothetical protein
MRAEQKRPGENETTGTTRQAGRSRVRPENGTGIAPGPMSAQTALALQRAVGNRAASRILDEDQHRSSVLDAIRSRSTPLDSRIRETAERAYRMDFGHVRVHSDAVAQRSAVELGARAYTTGSDIVVGPRGADDETMFHEIDHVYQQSLGPVAGTDNGTGTKVSHPGDPFERKSAENGRRMARGAVPDLGVPGTGAHDSRVQRAAATAVGSVQRVTEEAEDAITAAPASLASQRSGARLNSFLGSGVPAYWRDLDWEDTGEGYHTARIPRGHPVWDAVEEYARLSQERMPVTAPSQEMTRMRASRERLKNAGLTDEQRRAHERRLQEGKKGGPQPPRSFHMNIVEIVVCANPALWEKYVTSRKLYQQSLIRHGAHGLESTGKDRSDQIPWSTGSRPNLGSAAAIRPTDYGLPNEPLPMARPDAGEAFLWHGTAPQYMDDIQKGGFDPTKSKNKGTDDKPRYGVVGQGIYLADNASKGQLYYACPQCEDPECRDKSHPPRQLLLPRALLGSPDFAHLSIGPIGHNRRAEDAGKAMKQGRMSVMSPGIKKNPARLGATGTNEFMIKNVSFLYPEIRVYYRPATP